MKILIMTILFSILTCSTVKAEQLNMCGENLETSNAEDGYCMNPSAYECDGDAAFSGLDGKIECLGISTEVFYERYELI